MVEILFISKVVVSIIAVVGLSLVAEHVSPRVAGVLSGYPLGTAIALFFIGIENGKEFAAEGAVYTLAGFSSSLVLVYFYYKTSSLANRYIVLFSSISAILAFIFASFTLSLVSFGVVGAFLISVFSIVFFAYKFKNIENVVVGKKVTFTRWVLLFRALAAASIVLLITGLAKTIGPSWAGILSAFPITLFPFLLIIHLTYGKEQVHTIIKNYPFGLGSLLIYAISVSLVYPVYGVGIGTFLSFFFATLYLIIFAFVSKFLSEKRRRIQI